MKKSFIPFSFSLIVGSLAGFILSLLATRMFYLEAYPNGTYLGQLGYIFTSDYKYISLLLMLFGIVSVYFICFMKKDYKTPKKEVAKGIFTPISAGEGQYGSAKWLTETEKEKSYPAIILNKRDISEILEKINKEGVQHE